MQFSHCPHPFKGRGKIEDNTPKLFIGNYSETECGEDGGLTFNFLHVSVLQQSYVIKNRKKENKYLINTESAQWKIWRCREIANSSKVTTQKYLAY